MELKDAKPLYITVIVILIIAVGYLLSKTDYKNEIAKQDLRLKCQEIYSKSHESLESARYGLKNESADAIIWSPKTKTCLAYYNVQQEDYDDFLFEVWDYTNSDLVLSYRSELSDQCIQSGVIISMEKFIYKHNKSLEGSGCNLHLIESGTDLLKNFEKAMLDLGFKR